MTNTKTATLSDSDTNSESVEQRFTFPKHNRVLDSGGYRTITSKGRKKVSQSFLLFTQKTQETYSRIGLTVSRKVGNSVVRNRVKRQFREFFRLNQHTLQKGVDWVIIARPRAGQKKPEELREELKKTFSGFQNFL